MTEEPSPVRERPGRRGLVGPFSGRQLLVAVGSVAVAAVVLMAITTPLGSTAGPGVPDPRATQVIFASPTAGLAVGAVAPEFEGTLDDGTTWGLTDLDGEPVRLRDLRGKGVWINFWASWCPPCQQETPILRETAEAYRDRGLEVVAVDVQETLEDGRRYAERYDLDYTIGADVSGHVFRAYRVFGLPTQFFVDAEGVIRAVVPKPLTADEARLYVEAILPDAGASAPAPSASP